MKEIVNKQAKELYKRYVKITEQNSSTKKEKHYQNQTVQLISYLADVYERKQEDLPRFQTIFPDFERYQDFTLPHSKGHVLHTKNEVVATCFSHFRNVFYNKEEDKTKRVHAYVCMSIMRNMMRIYEMHTKLREEEMQDMVSKYDGFFRPMFPEELQQLFQNKNAKE